jgi:hypothetical protein
MTNRITSTLCAGVAALAVLAMTTSAEARGRGGGSSGEGDSWLRGELQNPQFVQPYGYASPNRMEYRPFYGYGYPYTPYPSRRRTVIEVYPYPY